MEHDNQLEGMREHSKLDNQRGDKGQRGSGGGLCLTLPSNFSPCSGSGGQRGSVGSCGSGGGSVSPGREKGSRASPLSTHHYNWEDLRRLFQSSLLKLFRMEPESIPFRQPVDTEELGIPDYNDIIRKPMDLQTIRTKMNTGKYTDAWAYIDDVLRMLDNAWVYNREGSKVYEYCTRLSEVFVEEVNPVMVHLGYKHGRTNSFQFNSDTISCHGRPVCFVRKGHGYWRDSSRDMEFNVCEGCYKAMDDGGSAPDVVVSSTSGFVYRVNSCKAYSPAAELHKSHLRDAEMSRQLVLREFLRMLMDGGTGGERKENVYKMLRCNGKLLGEFVEYVKRRRGMDAGCGVVYGEGFTTRDLDGLVERLGGLRVEEEGKRRSIVEEENKRRSLMVEEENKRRSIVEEKSVVEEESKKRSLTSDSGVESVVGSSNETLDLSIEECSEFN